MRVRRLHAGRRRAGITLTQMLVVMSLTTVITTAAVTVVISMLHLEGRTTHTWMSQETLLRLGDDFRDDAHAARFAEITTQNEAPAVIFQEAAGASRRVTYLAAEHQVTRRETDGDRVLRSEVYRLPECDVRFGSTTGAETSGRFRAGSAVRLTCQRPNVAPINRRTLVPRHDEQIVAVVGRDHRFEKPATNEMDP